MAVVAKSKKINLGAPQLKKKILASKITGFFSFFPTTKYTNRKIGRK
jgi:hypothetical protein